MKIVHVITRLILGGAQENTILSAREAARAGHDVLLLTGPETGPEGSLMDWARAEPFRTVLVPALCRAVHPPRDAVAAADLLKRFRDERPDVVHTHSSKAGILGRWAARRAGADAVVHTIHGLAFDRYGHAATNILYRWAERRAARWTDRRIAVSEDMAARAAEAGLAPREAIDVVYSGMDLARFRAAAPERDAVRAAWGAGPETFVFMKLARLAPRKGHPYVLAAFERVLAAYPEAMLVVAGEGAWRENLERQARARGVADRIRWTGLVPRARVPALLWASDAVVHAGLREGLGRVLVQAGVCARPVVAYDVGGAREVIRDGGNGFLLKPPPPRRRSAEDAAPMAEAMQRLAADPKAARAMGAAWPAEVLARFDAGLMGRRLLEIYASARKTSRER